MEDEFSVNQGLYAIPIGLFDCLDIVITIFITNIIALDQDLATVNSSHFTIPQTDFRVRASFYCALWLMIDSSSCTYHVIAMLRAIPYIPKLYTSFCSFIRFVFVNKYYKYNLSVKPHVGTF